MQIHLDHELELLRKELSTMCRRATESLVLAVRSLRDLDRELAARVVEDDREIDMLENKIDGMLLAILALQHPFAVDLRFLAAAMKINNDLERIGDKAVSVAKGVLSLKPGTPIADQVPPLVAMAERSLEMIRRAFDCFLSKDAATAEQVIRGDRDLDAMNSKAYDAIVTFLAGGADRAETGLALYRISSSLERIGDLAKNISEESIYYVRGEVVKHSGMDEESP